MRSATNSSSSHARRRRHSNYCPARSFDGNALSSRFTFLVSPARLWSLPRKRNDDGEPLAEVDRASTFVCTVCICEIDFVLADEQDERPIRQIRSATLSSMADCGPLKLDVSTAEIRARQRGTCPANLAFECPRVCFISWFRLIGAEKFPRLTHRTDGMQAVSPQVGKQMRP